MPDDLFVAAIRPFIVIKEVALLEDYIIVTNNPLVRDREGESHTVEFHDVGINEILKLIRDKVHSGHRLLTHPLSGSVKPGETPYKSVLMTRVTEEVDLMSVELAGSAVLAAGKFHFKSEEYDERAIRDFRIIDWTLIKSALESADSF